MKLIFGLGNPGFRYKNTRHNIGFLAVDRFAKSNKAKIEKKGFGSLFEKLIVAGEEVVLIKPQTFMNNSGEAVSAAREKFAADRGGMLIVCDDVNLELGMLRFRAGGSAGGHKGLESIIRELGTEDFNRLRIGIGGQKGRPLKDYVLSRFGLNERLVVKETIAAAADAAGAWISDGIEEAMNRFNAKNKIT